MASYASAVLIAVVGVIVLTGQTFSASARSRQIAVVLPPWKADGYRRITATGLPIVDLRWHGHIVVLDLQDDPRAFGDLQSAGFWLLDASGTALCDSIPEGIQDDRNG